MARSPSERSGSLPTGGSLLAAAFLSLQALDAFPAGVSRTFEIPQYSNMEINIREDTLTVEDVVITHGRGTRVEAAFARQTSKPGNVKQLDLTGQVKILFNGATLDAATAVMVFRGDQLDSVQVNGDQAQFSHQPQGLRRIFGRAASIRLETATGKLVFSGNTSYTDGCNRLTSSRITYNMNEGTVTDDGHPATSGRATLCLDPDGTLEIARYSNLVINVRDDTIRAEDVLINHGENTRVEARAAHQTGRSGDVQQLHLSGAVKIGFDDSTLDADTAVVAFRGEELVSVEVKGDQVEFSHQPEDFRRVFGRAGSVRYEAATGQLAFSGNPSYTDGCVTMAGYEEITYDINTGIATDDGNPDTRGSLTMCPDPRERRVPTPRTPERGTAQ